MMMGKKIKLLCRAVKLGDGTLTGSELDKQLGLTNGILEEITRIEALEQIAIEKGLGGGGPMMSKKIERQALELKCIIQRSMSIKDLETATGLINGILAETERVEGLEKAVIQTDQEAAY